MSDQLRTTTRAVLAAAFLAMAALACPVSASASQLIGYNASDVRLEVDGAGHALVTFTSSGKVQRVFASGAIDARDPSPSTPQIEFKLSSSGGAVRNACKPTRLALAWVVAACRAADGSYWALQSWQRQLPNLGAAPNPKQAAWELRLSHWSGTLATLEVHFGWSYRRYLQIFGRYSYRNQPVYGFKVANGVPLDGYGRNIYVDAFDSDLGKGWKRVNSFLAHGPIGGFCYGFFPHGGKIGVGRKYRATVIGPGVTPDVMWQANAPPAYTPAADKGADDAMRSLLAGDKLCRPN
ncbi:MAG TPA: hypothetical protein VJT84_03475 [Gaiellaceae bacterium]|nr:hypothetical protein [Gaiellaceae bacterium]